MTALPRMRSCYDARSNATLYIGLHCIVLRYFLYVLYNYLRHVTRACLLDATITNHDKYSLIRELTDEEWEKTLTLRRHDVT